MIRLVLSEQKATENLKKKRHSRNDALVASPVVPSSENTSHREVLSFQRSTHKFDCEHMIYNHLNSCLDLCFSSAVKIVFFF